MLQPQTTPRHVVGGHGAIIIYLSSHKYHSFPDDKIITIIIIYYYYYYYYSHWPARTLFSFFFGSLVRSFHFIVLFFVLQLSDFVPHLRPK